jgi:capsular polysaccharide biosynthesis protein
MKSGVHEIDHSDSDYSTRTGTAPEANGPAGIRVTDYTLPFSQVTQSIRRRVWLVVMMTIILTGAAVVLSLVRSPKYEASIIILVSQEEYAGPSANLAGDVEGLQMLTQTLTEVVRTRPVAEAVIQKLNLSMSPESLLENLRAQQTAGTSLIEVTYMDSSPKRAEQVANTLGDEFSSRVYAFSPQANAVAAKVWEPAVVPKSPVGPNFMLIVPVAVALGIALGAALALLLDYLDSSWRDAEDVEQAFGIPVLAAIPASNARPSERLLNAERKVDGKVG